MPNKCQPLSITQKKWRELENIKKVSITFRQMISFHMAKFKWQKIMFPLFFDPSRTLQCDFYNELILPCSVHKFIVQIGAK